jgi:hypothetical protein
MVFPRFAVINKLINFRNFRLPSHNPAVILRAQKAPTPRAREDEQVNKGEVFMIEAIYAKRVSYVARKCFWWWHQEHTPELTRTTMLEF